MNSPPSLQVLSGARENALAQSESILKGSSGGWNIWKYLEALARATGVSERFAYGFRTKLHSADVPLADHEVLIPPSSNENMEMLPPPSPDKSKRLPLLIPDQKIELTMSAPLHK